MLGSASYLFHLSDSVTSETVRIERTAERWKAFVSECEDQYRTLSEWCPERVDGRTIKCDELFYGYFFDFTNVVVEFFLVPN